MPSRIEKLSSGKVLCAYSQHTENILSWMGGPKLLLSMYTQYFREEFLLCILYGAIVAFRTVAQKKERMQKSIGRRREKGK